MFGQEVLDASLIEEAYEMYESDDIKLAIQKVNDYASQLVEGGEWSELIECQKFFAYLAYWGNDPNEVLPLLYDYHSKIPESKKTEKAYSSFFLGSTEEDLGNLFAALNFYLKTIKPFQQDDKNEILEMTYSNIAMIYSQFGEYSKAIKYLNASSEIVLETKDDISYAMNIYSIAENYFFKGSYGQSEKLFQKYLELIPNESYDVYFQLSIIKVSQEKLDSARILFSQARRLNVDNKISESEFNSLYAEILYKEGNIKGAIDLLNKSKSQIDSLYNKRSKGIYFYQLADLHSKNNLDSAIYNFNKSLQAFTDQRISVSSINDFSNNEFLFHEIWIGDILIGLSKVYHEKFKINKEESFRQKAEECIQYALQSLDYKRSFFEEIESSIFANKISKVLYEEAIDIYLSWYEESGKKEYLYTAFEIAQRHNAFVLRQQINERVVLDKYSVDDALKKEYLDQKLKVFESSFLLEGQYSQNGFEKLKVEESKLDSVSAIIVKNYPLFERSKIDFTVADTKDIQKQMDKKQAVIKYFEGSEKLYAFVITKNKLSYFVHDKVEVINDQVGQVRSILSNFRYNISDLDSLEKKYQEVSLNLYENILSREIASLSQRIKSLIIIPSGSLTQIPFESLIIKENKSWKDMNSFLVSKYAISYNYFCKALTFPSIQKHLDDVLAYGLEYDEYTLNASKKFSNDSISDQIIEKLRSEDMGHLYFADDEAQEVAEMFDGVSFLNENATKQSFLSNVLDYDIVHLSAHSFVDFQYPSNSSIIFTKKDSVTDNLLQIKDVDRLSFNGQLFTLSACNTFFGKQNEGEGLSSMARSFIQSGAGSVIGSFWSVPDEISKSFMVRFYSKLKEGLPKDKALQETKIDFMTDDNLSSPLYRSPAYWSAWVVYGDTQSIYTTDYRLMYFGIGVLIFGVILFWYFTKMRSSSPIE